MTKISNGIFIAATLVFLLLCGCRNSFGQAQGASAKSSSAKTIEVSLGQDAVITLEANHTTGYQWQLAKPLEGDLLEFVDTKYIPAETGLIGSGGEEVWTFKTLKKGKAEVCLKYVQPWEKDKPPARQATFMIIIK